MSILAKPLFAILAAFLIILPGTYSSTITNVYSVVQRDVPYSINSSSKTPNILLTEKENRTHTISEHLQGIANATKIIADATSNIEAQFAHDEETFNSESFQQDLHGFPRVLLKAAMASFLQPSSAQRLNQPDDKLQVFLDKVEKVAIDFAGRHGVPESNVQPYTAQIKPQIQELIVHTGQLLKQGSPTDPLITLLAQLLQPILGLIL